MALYPELFKTMERARWSLAGDVRWERFDPSALTDDQALTVKMNAITEWSALPATEMFLRDNRHDSDFSAFMSVWFYEEQKHALVLMEYLRRFRPALLPTDAELHAVRFEFDPAPPLETLTERTPVIDTPAARATTSACARASAMAAAIALCWALAWSERSDRTLDRPVPVTTIVWSGATPGVPA